MAMAWSNPPDQLRAIVRARIGLSTNKAMIAATTLRIG
jgi:hypothetical protein